MSLKVTNRATFKTIRSISYFLTVLLTSCERVKALFIVNSCRSDRQNKALKKHYTKIRKAYLKRVWTQSFLKADKHHLLSQAISDIKFGFILIIVKRISRPGDEMLMCLAQRWK